jgi:hypothetical protein
LLWDALYVPVPDTESVVHVSVKVRSTPSVDDVHVPFRLGLGRSITAVVMMKEPTAMALSSVGVVSTATVSAYGPAGNESPRMVATGMV